MPSSPSTLDTPRSSTGVPENGGSTVDPFDASDQLPPGYELFEQEEAHFAVLDAEHLDQPEPDRLRRWRHELRRGAAFCLVRMRAYGERRHHQQQVNAGLEPGTTVRMRDWDHANGWSYTHGYQAKKVYKAWKKHGDSYPLTWTGLTVREVLARLKDTNPTPRKITTGSILTSWLRNEYTASPVPTGKLQDTQAKVVTFTKRAVEAFGALGQEAVAELVAELRAVLDAAVEDVEADGTVEVGAEGEAEAEAQPDGDGGAQEPVESAEAREEAQTGGKAPETPHGALAGRDERDRAIDYVRAAAVPDGLVYLDKKPSRSPPKEKLRRDPADFEIPDSIEPIATLRKKTTLYRLTDPADTRLHGPDGSG